MENQVRVSRFQNDLVIEQVAFHSSDFLVGAIDIGTSDNLNWQSQFTFALRIVARHRQLRKDDRLTHIVLVAIAVREFISIEFGEGLQDRFRREFHHQGIEHTAMQHQAFLAFFLVLHDIRHTERGRGRIQEIQRIRIRSENRRIIAGITVETIQVLSFGSGQTELQMDCPASLLQIFKQGGRQVHTDRGVPRRMIHGVHRICGTIRSPRFKAPVPGRIRHLGYAVQELLSRSHIQFPAKIQLQVFFDRQGIRRIIFGSIKRAQPEQRKVCPGRIRFGKALHKAGIRHKGDIQHQIMAQARRVSEHSLVICRGRERIQEYLSRGNRQIRDVQSLHLIATWHPLIRKPVRQTIFV